MRIPVAEGIKLTSFDSSANIPNMRKQTILIIIGLCFLGMNIMANDLIGFSNRLPGELNGWKKDVKPNLYDPQTLFKYIDGGAELYISYNFKQVLAMKYLDEKGNEITVDIFDMGDSYNAFGVFSHGSEEPDKTDKRIGQGSEYAAGLLTFWKDRYYVSLLAYPETEERKKTVLTLGRDIADLIPTEGPLPPVLELLPKKGLDANSMIYFTHHHWLNSHYFISNENILHIGKETPAVLAAYKGETGKRGEKFFVLLVSYPDKAKSEAAYQSFIEQYLPDGEGGIKQLEDGRWTGSKLEGTYILVILDAPSREVVDGLRTAFSISIN
jgi:hypothetical protein